MCYNGAGGFMDVREINVLVLAYLGDTIYENYVRRYLVNSGIGNVNDLQREATKYVSAKSQASYVNKMLSKNIFLEDEIDVFKRARNYKTSSHPKNCDIITYKYATGLEAVIGYLSIINNNERIDKIMNFILN